MKIQGVVGACAALILVGSAHSGLTVSYTQDAGGQNINPLDGLSAEATWVLSGLTLEITLTNTSTGVPKAAEVSDSLLVSLAFNLPDAIQIASGDSAVIGPGSVGIGSWSGMVSGDSVGMEWLWTNDFGGDLLEDYAQVISTSNGQGGGTVTGFDGSSRPNVDGPFGGIAADPVLVPVPMDQYAVSDSITFSLTLTGTLTNDEFLMVAENAIVEFGSDYQYLSVPAPGVLALLGLSLLCARPRRR